MRQEELMSSSTNKSIADREQSRSHHALDEERHATRSASGNGRNDEPDHRGRSVEKEVSRRAKKK
jgi:hypothetical protein